LSCCHRLMSSLCSAASCPLTPPLQFASCLPAGCRVAPVVMLPPPLVLSTFLFASWLSCHILLHRLHLASPFFVPPSHVSILYPLLSFTPAGCSVASCCTASASRPLVNTTAYQPATTSRCSGNSTFHLHLTAPTGCRVAFSLACCRTASPHASTSHLLVTLPLIALLPLIMPLSMPLPLVPLISWCRVTSPHTAAIHLPAPLPLIAVAWPHLLSQASRPVGSCVPFPHPTFLAPYRRKNVGICWKFCESSHILLGT
jgi:hypothetical protein